MIGGFYGIIDEDWSPMEYYAMLMSQFIRKTALFNWVRRIKKGKQTHSSAACWVFIKVPFNFRPTVLLLMIIVHQTDRIFNSVCRWLIHFVLGHSFGPFPLNMKLFLYLYILVFSILSTWWDNCNHFTSNVINTFEIHLHLYVYFLLVFHLVFTLVLLRSFISITQPLLLLFSVLGCVMVLIVFISLQYDL